ncbi:MAG: nitroreductase family protein [Bacteroidales bacterium]|jgi:nitroreductase|nr:nitroreductase family protein [Bacteroidales bacterium]
MSSFYNLAQNRRSTRKFTEEAISSAQLENLLHTVLMSPASKSSNPWEFVVVQNLKTIEQLASAKAHGSTLLKTAPLAIVVCADPQKSDVWVEDCSIASIYLQLAAEDLGLGSCWVQIRGREHESGILAADYIKKLLNIPAHIEIESIIAIGHKVESRPPFNPEKLLLERIHHEIF